MQFSTLSQAMSHVSGASFVGIDTKTIPSLKGGKKNPMQGKITKVTTGSSVMVFQNKNTNAYENMVRRRLIQEGKNPDFEVGPRAWGERVKDTPFVSHKGKNYLEVIFLKPGKTQFFYDDQPIAREDIIGLDDDKSEGDQGGLNDKVIIRTFDVESITAVRIDNQVFA